MSSPTPIAYEESSGNVFADLGYDSETAAQLSHKAELVGVLHHLQQERDLSRSAFSRLVGISQPRLSKLYGGNIASMSTEKLLEAIAKLGGRIPIRVESHPAPADAGRVEIELA